MTLTRFIFIFHGETESEIGAHRQLLKDRSFTTLSSRARNWQGGSYIVEPAPPVAAGGAPAAGKEKQSRMSRQP